MPAVLLFSWGLSGCDEEAPALAPDLAPPDVVSITPSEGAVGVPVEAGVRIIFSEPVVIDSLASPPVRLDGPEGAVEATVELDSTSTILALTPAVLLLRGIDYRVTLAAGISDLAGNARQDSFVVRFTTALAFHDIGRIFFANEMSRDITVLDVNGYVEVAGSPVQLTVAPQRLCGVPEEGALYVLYRAALSAGVLVLDARSLTILRDTGLVLDGEIADLAVSHEDGLLLVASPRENALLVLDSATLAPVSDPLIFDRPDSEPIRIGIARRLRRVLVGLDGGARLAALALPSMESVPEFPVPVVESIHSISIDEERSRAWVGGSLRYAVVDLITPSRTSHWQMPETSCTYCTPRLWSLLLSPVYDRVYMLNRRQAVASVVLSNLDPAPESPGGLNLNYFLTEIVQDPRTADLIILGWRNLDTPVYRMRPETLTQVGFRLTEVGDKAVDMELMP